MTDERLLLLAQLTLAVEATTRVGWGSAFPNADDGHKAQKALRTLYADLMNEVVREVDAAWRTDLPDFTEYGFHKVKEVEYHLKDGTVKRGPYQGYGMFGYGALPPHDWSVDVVAWRPLP